MKTVSMGFAGFDGARLHPASGRQGGDHDRNGPGKDFNSFVSRGAGGHAKQTTVFSSAPSGVADGETAFGDAVTGPNFRSDKLAWQAARQHAGAQVHGDTGSGTQETATGEADAPGGRPSFAQLPRMLAGSGETSAPATHAEPDGAEAGTTPRQSLPATDAAADGVAASSPDSAVTDREVGHHGRPNGPAHSAEAADNALTDGAAPAAQLDVHDDDAATPENHAVHQSAMPDAVRNRTAAPTSAQPRDGEADDPLAEMSPDAPLSEHSTEALAGKRRHAADADDAATAGTPASGAQADPAPVFAAVPAGPVTGNRDDALAHAATMASGAQGGNAPAGLAHARSLHGQEPDAQPGAGNNGAVDADMPATANPGKRGPEKSGAQRERMPALDASARRERSEPRAEGSRLPDAASPVARDVTASGQFTTPSGIHKSPGQAVPGGNVQSLMTAIRHNSGWTKFLSDPVAHLSHHTGPGGVNVDVLKIDLHPASLGRMEASLKARGERVSITITVSSHEAAASIGSDIAGIQAGLRAAGHTVDQVIVETRGQSDAPAGWNAPHQDASAGGFAGGNGRREPAAPAGSAPGLAPMGNTGNDTSTSSSRSGYVI